MRKITLSLFFLSLAVLVAAQGKNDRAWLDLNQARTLWMASGNAAGLAVQAPQSFNLVEARYDREDGSWRPLQSGEHTANVQFDTQGARQIGAFRLWGHFRYNNVNEKASSFNTLLYNPYDERFLYMAADSVEGQWKKQSYEMEFKAAVPLGEHLTTGLHVHYADRIAAGQIDPRAESYHYAVTVKPGLVWKTGASRIGLNGLYAHTLERSTPSISNSQQIQKVYLMRGLGNFVGEQVGGGGLSTMYFRCNTWGGSLQYGYSDGWQLLAEASYAYHNSRIRESPTQPKPHGTTRQEEGGLKVQALFGEGLLHKITLDAKLIRTIGTEPTTRWNTATGEWEVRYELDQVVLKTAGISLAYDGFVLDGDAYTWKLHGELGWEKKDDSYALPASSFAYGNLRAALGAERRWALRKGSLQGGLSAEANKNLSGSYEYNGHRAVNAPARDLYPHNLAVLAADWIKAGLKGEYAFPVGQDVNLAFCAEAAWLGARPAGRSGAADTGNLNRLYTLAAVKLYF